MSDRQTTILPAQPGQMCVLFYTGDGDEPEVDRLPIVGWLVTHWPDDDPREPDHVRQPVPITCFTGSVAPDWTMLELPDGKLAHLGDDDTLIYSDLAEAIEDFKHAQRVRLILQRRGLLHEKSSCEAV